MGTNYYYKIPLKEREIKGLQEMITADPDFRELKDCIQEMEQQKNIHLGKRSRGWQFLWDFHNGRFYAANLKSIENFLENRGGYIVDEEDRIYSTKQFLKDEIGDCLYKDENHCDAYSYHEKYPEEPRYDISKHEFSNKGLRFSIHENFS